MKSGRALTVLLAFVAMALIVTGTVLRAQGGAAPVAAPLRARVDVTTKQGCFPSTLAALALGRRLELLNGAVLAERVPLGTQLTATPDEEDFPACASAPDGTVWCAYVAYRHGTPI